MIKFIALETDAIQQLQIGAPDANGQTPEQAICHDSGYPCRHCLQHIGQDEPYLILAWRPFTNVQPYAETGPIFLHANSCERYPEAASLPPIFSSDSYIIRAYNHEQRIIYGSGSVVAHEQITHHAKQLLADPAASFLHLRSASNNCFLCRVERF